MTLAEVLTLYSNLLLYDLSDSTGSGETPTTAQKLTSINAAIRQIGKYCELYDPSITFTLVAGQAIYNLRTACGRKVVRPYAVIINGNPLWNAARTERGMWTLHELERNYPNWRAADSGTPTKAALYATHSIILHCPPDATCVADGNNFVSGTYIPADMTDAQTANTPDLPEELHEALAYLAAVKSAMPFASEVLEWQKLQAYSSEAMAFMNELRTENRRLLTSWGSSSGYYWPDTMSL